MDAQYSGASLGESVGHYRLLVDMSPDGIIVIQDSYHVFANATALRVMGAETVADLRRHPALSYMHPTDRELAAGRLHAMHEEGKHLLYVEERLVSLDGRVIEIEAAGSPITFSGRPAALVCFREIGARKAAQQAQWRAEQRFQSAFRHAPIGMAIVDGSGRVVECNGALAQLLACPAERLAGSLLSAAVVPEDQSALQSVLDRLSGGGSEAETAEVRCVRGDGATVWARMAISAGPADAAVETTFVVQVEDVTAARTAEAELTHQAMHDPLTDLPNRLLFLDRLARALRRSEVSGAPVIVLFCDLDLFKVVNDTHGHAAGDHVLQECARRIRLAVRPADTVARLGGDEFLVLVEEAGDRQSARIIADRITAVVQAPIAFRKTRLGVHVSVGYAISGKHETPETIMGKADRAMYAAKAAKRLAAAHGAASAPGEKHAS